MSDSRLGNECRERYIAYCLFGNYPASDFQLGHEVMNAIERVLSEDALLTPEVGGPADTKTCGAPIADAVLQGI